MIIDEFYRSKEVYILYITIVKMCANFQNSFRSNWDDVWDYGVGFHFDD